LQTHYPVILFQDALKWRGGLTEVDANTLRLFVHNLLRTGRVLREAHVPPLWISDSSLSNVVGTIRLPGARPTPVRCGKQFEWTLFEGHWATEVRVEVGLALQRLFDKVVPDGNSLLARRYPPAVLLELCDFDVAKAFVYGMILMSKWLGEVRFPVGVHVWPPPMPEVVLID
jgi:hypothetical protein